MTQNYVNWIVANYILTKISILKLNTHQINIIDLIMLLATKVNESQNAC